MRCRLAALAALLLAAAGLAGGCGGHSTRTSGTSGYPMAMFEDDARLLADPAGTLLELRGLGVSIVRVDIPWSYIAPAPGSTTRPPGFDASDPAAYPAANWGPYDAVVRYAHQDGLKLDFLLTSPAPLWAAAAGPPHGVPPGAWKPSASAFGQFVHAIGVRYGGHYAPSRGAVPLPPVDSWEIWDEPNWGPSLAPQFPVGSLEILSASEYRDLLDAAWSALEGTGHAHDTILIGDLSPRGLTAPPQSVFAASLQASSPLGFTRSLYCVSSSYTPLRGPAAVRVGCPAHADSQRFRTMHPALFGATGFGVHPYPVNLPPTESDSTDPDTTEFSEIPHLTAALDRLQSAYESPHKLDIYNTEYGYITHPPNVGTGYLSPAIAAGYLNWTEYLSWRNPRIATTSQYGLSDSKPAQSVFGFGGFATGLLFYGDKPKQTFYAYRLPIFLPVSHTTRGHALEVWGCARPAHYAYLDTHQTQYVQIQFRAAPAGAFQTIRTVPLDAASSCDFDVHVKFPGSGTVRLAWSYPAHDPGLTNALKGGQLTIHSRNVGIGVG